MKVFLSWSGAPSKEIAQIFREWLPAVLQFIDPYYTPEDIEKGLRWSTDIASELDACEIGIIFLTQGNLQSPWIMFEAGALSKKLETSKVCPILFGVKTSDVQGPLVQFQATRFDKADMLKLLGMLNRAADTRGITPTVLDKAFEVWWPSLDLAVGKALSGQSEVKGASPTERQMLEELLDLVRNNYRQEALAEQIEKQFQVEQQFHRATSAISEKLANSKNYHRSITETIEAVPGVLSSFFVLSSQGTLSEVRIVAEHDFSKQSIIHDVLTALNRVHNISILPRSIIFTEYPTESTDLGPDDN